MCNLQWKTRVFGSTAALCVAVVMLTGGLATPTAVAAQSLDYLDFGRPPGDVGFQTTNVSGIDAKGDVVGYFQDTANDYHSFVVSAGTFYSIAFPGSVSTLVSAINDSGQMAGYFYGADNYYHGFVLSGVGGTYTRIDAPEAPSETYIAAINNSGQLVGYYRDARFNYHNLLYSAGTATRIGPDIPGSYTYTVGINNAGQIAGTFTENAGPTGFEVHGFVLADNVVTQIDVPGAIETYVVAMNNSGELVGYFSATNSGPYQYFLYDHGRYTILNPPAAYAGAQFYSINDSGQLAGYRVNCSGACGVLLTGQTYTTVGPPGVNSTVQVINDSGVMAGLYRDASATPHIFEAGACLMSGNDSDGDGLCDDWEINGIRDANGNMLLDLPAMGADPKHKDIFVEIDYMDCGVSGSSGASCSTPHNHRPDPHALQMVVAAFAAAPVQNPDGQTGINLHFDEANEEPLAHAEQIDLSANASGNPSFSSAFDLLKLGPELSLDNCDGHFGTPADRAAANCADRLEARRRVFHYVIFGHDQLPPNAGSSGRSELPGNDTLVTLGAVTSDTFSSFAVDCLAGENRPACGKRNSEAGTLMHELGHSLGLHHGGGDDQNCKPNYLSVMTYSRQFPDLLPFRPLDYSRQQYLPLNENEPNEVVGIADGAGNVPHQFAVWGLNGVPVKALADGSLDWDQDGSFSLSAPSTDLNRIDRVGCSGGHDDPAISVLEGYNDWANLIYNFRFSPDYADGVARQTLTDTPEMTADQALAGGLAIDFDGDGIPNALDNCPGNYNPDQLDSVGNGIGDACRPAGATDTSPPATAVSVAPSANAAGWNNTDVTLAFTASDNPGGSGPKAIVYSATGALDSSLTVPGATASLVISAEGTTTITYFSRDNAGNVEAPHTLVVRIDKTPPSISATRSPQANVYGWNNTDVSVSFLCSDTLSGLAAGSPPAAVSLTAEGAGQSASGACVDVAGNSAAVTLDGINIDKTPPTLVCSASPKVVWPPDNKLVPVNTSVVLDDSLSGAAGFQLLNIGSNEPDSGKGDIVGWQVGAPGTSGQLRATRSGSGTGRIYTLSYSGVDKAGNAASCAATVSVPHDQGR